MFEILGLLRMFGPHSQRRLQVLLGSLGTGLFINRETDFDEEGVLDYSLIHFLRSVICSSTRRDICTAQVLVTYSNATLWFLTISAA